MAVPDVLPQSAQTCTLRRRQFLRLALVFGSCYAVLFELSGSFQAAQGVAFSGSCFPKMGGIKVDAALTYL